MKVVADENIPYVKDAFGGLGEVVTLPGRDVVSVSVRDADILLEHKAHCDVFLSLCSLDQGIVSQLELNAPPVAERLRTVWALKEAGVDINIDAAPWIPGVSDVGALLNLLPPGVGVQVAPLDLTGIGYEVALAGMRLTQEQINSAYQQHKESMGHDPRVTWKDPVPWEPSLGQDTGHT